MHGLNYDSKSKASGLTATFAEVIHSTRSSQEDWPQLLCESLDGLASGACSTFALCFFFAARNLTSFYLLSCLFLGSCADSLQLRLVRHSRSWSRIDALVVSQCEFEFQVQ